MIDRENELPMTKQCKILETLPVKPVLQACPGEHSGYGADAPHRRAAFEYPFYGSRKIRDELRSKGYKIGRGHVSALMRKMGIAALYRKPRLSKPHPEHKVYPYLLRGLEINRANHVWAADICYLPMARGFCYLVAVMDWASRKVLSWRLSNTLDTSFCIEALEEAIETYGAPEIFNTDQGSQFTSEDFTGILLKNGIRISMDGQRTVEWTMCSSNDCGEA